MKSSRLIKLSVVSVLMSSSLWALSLDEAITKGLANDASIKALRLSEQATLEGVHKAQSGKMPQVNLAYGYTYEKQRNPNATFNTSALGVSASYNLFNGFATKYAIKGYEEAYKSSQFATKALIADTKLSIEEAYVGVLRAKQQLKVREEALELLEKNFNDTNSFYKQGLVAKNSLLETQVALSSSKQDLLKAKSDLTLAKELLNRRLGLRLKEDEPLDEVATELEVEKTLAQLKEIALAKRSEIKSYEALAAQAGYQMKGANASNYPIVDISLSHTYYGDNWTPDNNKNIYDRETQGELSIGYNLYDGGASQSDRARYMYTQQAINENLQALRLDISLQVDQAYEAFRVARESMQVASDRLAFAKENFYIVERRYKVQIETTSTLLDARLDLTEAQVGYVNATYDVFETYASLRRILEE